MTSASVIVFDAHRDSLLFGHLRGAITPRTGYDLKAVLGEGPNKQGRKNALAADARCEFLKGRLVKDAAGVGLRFVELREWKVAVFGGIDNGRFHLNKLLSSG